MAYNTIVFKISEGIAIITFNRPEILNALSTEALKEFSNALDEIHANEDVRVLILTGAGEKSFVAGADIKEFSTFNPLKAKSFSEMGHSLMNKLQELPIPVIAAVNGFALGGGCEVAMACDFICASENAIFGLPEITLGIIPGFGGTQRLPRLIGLSAMELILKGSVFPAAQALTLGVVDRLVPADSDLLADSIEFLKEIIGGDADLQRVEHDFETIDVVAEQAQQAMLKATKGREIPGHTLAIASMRDGLKVSLEEGLKIEINNFAEAVVSNQAKGSIHTFFLKTMSDKPKSMMTKGFEPRKINKVAILGFGNMGRGIAINILKDSKMQVLVKEIPEAIEAGKEFVHKILTGMYEKKRLKTPVDELMARLTVVPEFSEEFKDVDLVIEAVFEDLKVKEQVYGELCEIVSDECLIVSNTSSIPLDTIAPFVKNPKRFAGVHFFSPAWIMQLVEVIRGEKTDQQTVDNLLNFVGAIRKRPVVCRDNPGFVVNALLFPYFLAALDFLECGNSIEEIDKAFVQFGMPVGPIRLADEVGIDVLNNIMMGMGIRQDTLNNFVADDRFGVKKSGKGFFLRDGSVDQEGLSFVAAKHDKKLSATEMQDIVMVKMIAIGHDLLERKIVDDPRMIDIGMIWGSGFPADKGGPLKWADLTGLSDNQFGEKFYQ